MGKMITSLCLVTLFHSLFSLMFLDEITARNISTDEDALLAFKAHITDDPHNRITSNWSKDTSVCDWIGITCGTRHRRVIGLQLRNMSLTGTIPPDIGNLSFLANFSLYINNFHGSLPDQLANLRRLKWFDLGFNLLNGIIPSWIGSFTQLQYLDLYSNNFGGVIPTSLCNLSKIHHLYLGINNLQCQIPEAIGNLQSLETLALNDNKLSGGLPIGISNISSLRVLEASTNNLTGEITKSTGNLVNLEWLNLRSNSIGGTLPSSIGNLSRIRSFYVQENMFKARNISTDEDALLAFKAHFTNDPQNLIASNWTKGTSVCDWIGITCGTRHLRVIGLQLRNMSITGTIPPHIGNLSCLTNFSLSINHFHGTLPGQLANLRRLKLFDLGFNLFNGIIPSWIGSFTQLQYLDLYSNNFGGVIPTSLYNLSKLNYLILGINNLEGRIPEAIGNLQSLEILSLEKNKLSGGVPIGIFNISSLQVIDVSHNWLSSSIPTTTLFRNISSLRVLDFNTNNLTGSLPSTLFSHLPALEFLGFSLNSLSGSIPSALFTCKRLQRLSLSFNNFQGNLHNDIGNLAMLQVLYVGYNNLKGVIPTSLCNLSKLKNLDFSSHLPHESTDFQFPAEKIGEMYGFSRVSTKDDKEVDLEAGNRETLYPALSLGENQLRWGLIRKVYGILAVQLVLTTLVSAVTVLYTPINTLLGESPGLLLFLCIVPFVLLWPLHVYHQKHPVNLIILGFFTISLSFLVGISCANTDGTIVLEALILTSAVVCSLTAYTFWASKKGKDFSFLGPILFTSLIILFLTSFMQMFFPLGSTSTAIYGGISALVFSGYIIYDTDNLIKRFTYDEYILASAALYLDILNLFLSILRILSQRNN